MSTSCVNINVHIFSLCDIEQLASLTFDIDIRVKNGAEFKGRPQSSIGFADHVHVATLAATLVQVVKATLVKSTVAF